MRKPQDLLIALLCVVVSGSDAPDPSSTTIAATDGPLKVLQPPKRLLPLHRWPAEPEIQNLQLSDGTIVTLRNLRAQGPRVFEVTGFLNATEASDLIELAKPRLEEDLMGLGSAEAEGMKWRRSRSAHFHNGKSPLVDAINQRTADLTRVPLEFWSSNELLTVVQYTAGGHYHAHDDSRHLEEMETEAAESGVLNPGGGPRFITLLIFLNDVSDGGETVFPLAGWSSKDHKLLENDRVFDKVASTCFTKKKKGLKIKAQAGKGLLWYNHGLEDDGQLGDLDDNAWHAGCKVKAGEKWVMNRWVPGPLPNSYTARSLQPDLHLFQASGSKGLEL